MATWKTCTIAWQFTDPSHTAAVFWADAGERTRAHKLAQGDKTFQPKRRLTGYEASYALTQNEQTREALDEIVSQLRQAGWEEFGEAGMYWWNRSFRQEVTAVAAQGR